MRIFLTGATGFIGTALIPELLQAGHTVLGLTRSDGGATKLIVAGAEAHRGTLEDLDSLRSGAANVDAVIHCAFDHDFSSAESFTASCAKDTRAIEAIGEVLKGSNRPLLITSGTGMGSRGPGQLATEDHLDLSHPNPRTASEKACLALQEQGVNVSVMRLPQVHDPVKQGLISWVVPIARAKGFSAYVGDGLNRWPAAHVSDVARLYRLAIERAEPGARYNAVAEEGITVKAIAEAIGKGLNIPVKSLTMEEAAPHFGLMAMFVPMDMPASSALTRETTGWNPTGPGLIADLAAMDYSAT